MSAVWSSHTMEHYSSLKRKGILTHVTTWVDFENVTLNKISQTQDTYWVSHHGMFLKRSDP